MVLYGNIYHQYTPNVSIYTSTMDPMGNKPIMAESPLIFCWTVQRPRWPSPEEQQANAETRFMIQVGWESRWVWINTYENTILRGMNIHKSQLF